MKKIFGKVKVRVLFLLLALILCVSVMSACGKDESNPEQNPGKNPGGNTEQKGEVESVTLLYNGEAVESGVIDLSYDVDDDTKNVYTFTVRINKTGVVDEVDEMVFWTSDNAAVATVTDKGNEAEVRLVGGSGSVTITVSSLLYSDTIYDSVTLNVKPLITVDEPGTYRFEAEDAVLDKASVEQTKDYYIYTPGTAYSEAVKGSASGGANTAMNALGSSVSFNVWSESERSVKLVMCFAPSANNKGGGYSYDFDDVIGISVNGEEVTGTGIVVNIPDGNTTSATGVGCYYYYTVYQSEVELPFAEGNNIIKLESLGEGYTNVTRSPNFDYIELIAYPESDIGVDSVTIMKNGVAVGETDNFFYSDNNNTAEYTANIKTTGSDVSRNIIWESSNTEIATVAGGTVTFTGEPGTFTLTAKAESEPSVYDSVEITVSGDSVNSVKIKKGGADAEDDVCIIGLNESEFAYAAEVDVTGSVSNAVTWSSSDEGIATVENGTVSFVGKKGNVIITATSVANSAVYDSVNIEVKVPMDIINGADTYRLEAENSVVSGAKVENTSQYYIYTPGTEYADATPSSASGGKNTSMSGKNNSITFEVWSDTARDVTLKICVAPSTSTKSSVYEYDFDSCVGTYVNATKVQDTGITITIPEKTITDATGVGCYFYYTVYTSVTTLHLTEGMNTIQFKQLGDGYRNENRSPNFDYIELFAE